MAGLFWNGSRREISAALSGVGELKFLISNSLSDAGFQGVEVNDLEVKGFKGDTLSSIGHFPIADRLYWEVVMTGGDDANAGTINAEIVRILSVFPIA